MSFRFLYLRHEFPKLTLGVRLIMNVFCPIATNCVLKEPSNVLTAVPAPMIANMPMDMLSNVSTVLSVFALMDCNACMMLSRIFMMFYDS